MPRIDGRAVGRRLILIWSVAQDVVKLSRRPQRAHVQFTNRIAYAVPAIG